MKLLKQNHHGLPGIGVNGIHGEKGQKGNSVYFGYINDFFDGEMLDLKTYVYVAKRLMGEYENNKNITSAELSAYGESILNNFLDPSTENPSTEYLYYGDAYYANHRFSYDTNSSMLETTPKKFINDVSIYINDANEIEMDIVGDHMLMSFMMKSVEDENYYAYPGHYDLEKDTHVTTNFQDLRKQVLSETYANLIPRVIYYEWDDAGSVIGQIKGNKMAFDTIDALFLYDGDDEEKYELGKFDFDNNKNASSWDGGEIKYIVEDIYKKEPYTTLYATDTDVVDASFNEEKYAVFPRNPNKYTYLSSELAKNDKIDTMWNMLYKTSSKVDIPRKVSESTRNPSIYEQGDLLDAKNRAFYGIPARILFNRSKYDTSLSSARSILKDYYSEDTNVYKDRVKTIINTDDGMQLYYSLDDEDTKVFIPFSLKSDYKAGDVLYFYTDINTFLRPLYTDQSFQITNMVVITDDLINCTPQQLVNATILENPFDVKIVRTNDKHINLYHNTAVMFDHVNSSLNEYRNFYNKSFVSILDKYTTAPVMLCDYNNIQDLSTYNDKWMPRQCLYFISPYSYTYDKSLHKIDKIYANAQYDSSYYYLNFNKITLSDFAYISSMERAKLDNLYINIENLTNQTTVELKNLIYSKNIIFYENQNIKPLVDLDLYFDNNNEFASVFRYKIDGNDYFYNINELDDYIFGCDIYNEKFEKIKTISSTETSYMFELIPTLDISSKNEIKTNSYYIQMFASNCGLKYYSKFAKLTVNYAKFDYLDDIKQMKLANGYASPIGKYSKNIKSKTEKKYSKSVGDYSKYMISSYNLDILGNDQLLTKEMVTTDNILFDISEINSEQNLNTSLYIRTASDDIVIDKVYFNCVEFDNDKNPITINDWSCIKVENENSVYLIDMSTNLPKYYGDSDVKTTFSDYLLTGSDTDHDESLLFKNILNNNVPIPTQKRSILVTVVYHNINRINEKFIENYSIVQPGFTDTRDLPNIELKLENDNLALESINSDKNNVLCNQFITNLYIDIKDFASKWGKFKNEDTSILLDLTIENMEYDLDWQNKYFVADITSRRTFRSILEQDADKLNNYVKFEIKPVESTLEPKQIDITTNIFGYNYNEGINEQIYPLNDKYVMFDPSVCKILNNPTAISDGLQHNIKINLKDINLTSKTDKLKLQLLTEFGNPIISNLYYRFYVSQASIRIKDSRGEFVFHTYTPSKETETKETYLCKIIMQELTPAAANIHIEYKFASESVDATFIPLSYILCPNDKESTYQNMYGDIYKYGVKEQIKKEFKFFNSDVYNNLEHYVFSDSNIRKNSNYSFNELIIKKSYIQDNIKNINAKPISLYKLLNNNIDISANESLKIDSSLYNHNVLDFIEDAKYLSIVYHSTILVPRMRKNEKFTFFYNDKEYYREKYDQKINNMPIFAYDEESIELRDDYLISSMDAWNDWYAENKSYNNKLYNGVLSLYGNAYTQIIDASISKIKDFYSLQDVVDLNNDVITDSSSYNEVNIDPVNDTYPDNGEYKRGFLYDINWEFPYYDKQNIIPYRIVSQFDNLLNNIDNIPDDYTDYYNKLVSFNRYEDRMIPYSLLFNIQPRIAKNYDTNYLNVFMLRKPCIGIDTDNISANDFEEKYLFNRRLFNLSSYVDINSPYIIK